MSFKQRIEQCGLAESRPTIRRMFLEYQTDNEIEDEDMIVLYGKAKHLHDTSGEAVQIQNIPRMLTALEPVFEEIGAEPLPFDAPERMFVLDCCVKYIEGESPLASPNSDDPSVALKKALRTYGRAAMWAFKTHNNDINPGVEIHVMPALKDLSLCRQSELYTWSDMVEALKDVYCESLLRSLEEKEGYPSSAGSPAAATNEFRVAVENQEGTKPKKKGFFKRKAAEQPPTCKQMWERWLTERIEHIEYPYFGENGEIEMV